MELLTIPADAKRFTNSGGYVTIKSARDHPLSDRQHRVGLHRVVLWEHLGQPEGSDCHWCDYRLPWKAASHRYCINVDHLDGDPSNNDPANLVPSCWWCNANRTWAATNQDLWCQLRVLYRFVHPVQRPIASELLKLLVVELGNEAPGRFIAAARAAVS